MTSAIRINSTEARSVSTQCPSSVLPDIPELRRGRIRATLVSFRTSCRRTDRPPARSRRPRPPPAEVAGTPVARTARMALWRLARQSPTAVCRVHNTPSDRRGRRRRPASSVASIRQGVDSVCTSIPSCRSDLHRHFRIVARAAGDQQHRGERILLRPALLDQVQFRGGAVRRGPTA